MPVLITHIIEENKSYRDMLMGREGKNKEQFLKKNPMKLYCHL